MTRVVDIVDTTTRDGNQSLWGATGLTAGDILAVAQHQASGALPADGALNAKLAPGTAFTIVSAAA